MPPRLLRHFVCLTTVAPSAEALQSIYLALMGSRMPALPPDVLAFLPQLTAASAALHVGVASALVPTATTCHYVWTARSLTAVFSAVATFATPELCDTPMALARLWRHEVQRTYADRLVRAQDAAVFEGLLREHTAHLLSDLDQHQLHTPSRLCLPNRAMMWSA